MKYECGRFVFLNEIQELVEKINQRGDRAVVETLGPLPHADCKVLSVRNPVEFM